MTRPLVWLAALAVVPAWAGEPMVHYEVRAGDTLYGIAERHLASPEDWREIQRLNGVRQPRRLPPGMRLLLPLERIRGVEQAATVLYVSGEAEVGDGVTRRPLQPGEALNEGVSVSVPPGGFVGLGLADGSALHLQGDTRIGLTRLREAGAVGVRDNRIQLERGRVDATVKPQSPGSRFDVRTPRAVTGVRGTRFGVGLGGDGVTVATDVIDGRVQMLATARPDAALDLAAGDGAVLAAGGRSPQRAALLPAPALVAPDAPVERMPQTLTLAPQPGATAYRAQLDDGATPPRVLLDRSSTQPELALADLPDGDYRLRLRAVDAQGLMGLEHAQVLRVRATPVPPLAQSPAPGAVVAAGPVDFRCTEVPGVAAYVLQLSTDAAFATLAHEQRQVGRCAFTLALDAHGDEYLWRVASVLEPAQGAPRRGPFGDVARVRVVAAPLAPSGLQSGGDGSVLHWSGHAGERYRVQVSPSQDFATLLQDLEVDQPTVQLELPACRPHFVRLSTRSPQGLWSGFSPPRQVGALGGLCSSSGDAVGGPDAGGWHLRPR